MTRFITMRALLIGIAGWLAAAIPGVPGVSAWAEDWPQWRGPRGDGTWAGPADAPLPDAWPSDGPTQKWSVKIGGGYAGVTVADGRVYTMDRLDNAAGEGVFERVLCFDADTGEPVWRHVYKVDYEGLSYDSGPRASVTIHDGRAYAAGAVGHLHCFDAKSGEVLWAKDTERDYGANRPTWGFAASPFIYEDLVIVQLGQRPVGCVSAFDRVTGRLVWRGGEDPAGYATPTLVKHVPQADGGGDAQAYEQLIVWTPKHITGMSPRTGEVQWKVPYEIRYGVSIAKPIVHEGIVFIAGYWHGSRAIRLGETPGGAALAWSNERDLHGLMSQPLYRQGLVYLLDKDHGLTCFELKTGKKLWDDDHQLTPRGRNPQATLVWADCDSATGEPRSGRALALNSEGELVMLNLRPDGYRELSRAKIIGKTWAHPAYAGRHVFARDDERLVCVELAPQ